VPKTGDDGEVSAPLNLVSANLDPGESVSGEWSVWADPNEASHVEPGTYRFDNEVSLTSKTLESDGEPIPWTLSITITD